MHLVFVYGTLKRGLRLHGFMQDAEFVCEARTGKEFTLCVDHLPYLIKHPGKGAVGEVFRVDDKTLERLDRLEGHPKFYCRTSIKVIDSGGKKIEVFGYIYQRFNEGVPKKARVTENYQESGKW